MSQGRGSRSGSRGVWVVVMAARLGEGAAHSISDVVDENRPGDLPRRVTAAVRAAGRGRGRPPEQWTVVRGGAGPAESAWRQGPGDLVHSDVSPLAHADADHQVRQIDHAKPQTRSAGALRNSQ